MQHMTLLLISADLVFISLYFSYIIIVNTEKILSKSLRKLYKRIKSAAGYSEQYKNLGIEITKLNYRIIKAGKSIRIKNTFVFVRKQETDMKIAN